MEYAMMRQLNCYSCQYRIAYLKTDIVEAAVVEKYNISMLDSMCNAMYAVHRDMSVVSLKQSRSEFSRKEVRNSGELLALTLLGGFVV